MADYKGCMGIALITGVFFLLNGCDDPSSNQNKPPLLSLMDLGLDHQGGSTHTDVYIDSLDTDLDYSETQLDQLVDAQSNEDQSLLNEDQGMASRFTCGTESQCPQGYQCQCGTPGVEVDSQDPR